MQNPLQVGLSGLRVSQAGFAVTVLILANLASSVAAQTVGSQPTGPRMSFEVASIRPNKSNARSRSNLPIGPGRVYVPHGGIFSATNVLLIDFIGFAYNMTESQMENLAHDVPDWVTQQGFDITARAEGEPTENQLRLMMQSLLADRFKLAIRKREDQQVPVLALVFVRPGTRGPHLLSHSSDPPCPNRAPPAEARETVSGGYRVACNGIVMLPPSIPGRVRIGARNVTLSFFAQSMSASPLVDLGRPLIDGTGLTGTSDFTLEWTPELQGSPPADGTFRPDPTGPTFREALRDQLGLKLKSQKGTVESFVIDHVERPSEN